MLFKVVILHCTSSQSKSCIPNFTELKVQKHYHQNILKVPKVKVLIMQNSTFQNNIYFIIGLLLSML